MRKIAPAARGAVELGDDHAGDLHGLGEERAPAGSRSGRWWRRARARPRAARPRACARSTRRTFASSSMSCFCVCRRPAVSSRTTSYAEHDALVSTRLEGHRGRVRARFLAHDLDGAALGPDRELVGGRGAVGVARADQHRAALRVAKRCASLAIEVVLPEPLTPTTRITVGRSRRARTPAAARAGARAARLRRRARTSASPWTSPRWWRRCEVLHELARQRAEVGRVEQRLELAEQRRVHRAPAAEEPGDAVGERGARARRGAFLMRSRRPILIPPRARRDVSLGRHGGRAWPDLFAGPRAKRREWPVAPAAATARGRGAVAS